jgi:hypothetical protein
MQAWYSSRVNPSGHSPKHTCPRPVCFCSERDNDRHFMWDVWGEIWHKLFEAHSSRTFSQYSPLFTQKLKNFSLGDEKNRESLRWQTSIEVSAMTRNKAYIRINNCLNTIKQTLVFGIERTAITNKYSVYMSHWCSRFRISCNNSF